MNTKLFRILTLAVIGASFTGASTVAKAGGWEDRYEAAIHRAERRIQELRSDKREAAEHHDWRAVKKIDRNIDHLYDVIKIDRAERDRNRDRHGDRDRDRDGHRG